MDKIIITAFFMAALLISCEESGNRAGKSDTVVKGRGISVTASDDMKPVQVKDSILEGEHIERYDNGVIRMRGEIRGGLRHGEWLSFYPNAKLWSQGTYINGYREGYGVAYQENGKKKEEGYYKKGRKVGLWKWWDDAGTVKEVDMGGDTTNILGK